MVVWLFGVLLVPWATICGFVRPPLAPLQPQMQLISRLDVFHRNSRLRGRRCVAAMSGEPVGLLDGQLVHGDGKGGYEFDVNGQRLAIKPSFHSHIKFCIEPDTSAMGTDKGQENKEGDQPPAPAPTSAARPAADEGAAAGKGENTADDGFVEHPSLGLRYKVVQEGTGHAPTLSQAVEWHLTVWRDAFDGNDTWVDIRCWETYLREADSPVADLLLSMREGEMRQILGLRGVEDGFAQLRLIKIIDGSPQRQLPHPAPRNGNAISDGFVRQPSGAFSKVVRQGTGSVPTLNDTVKYDWISWSNGFDTNDDFYKVYGLEYRLSDFGNGWLREGLLSMREGEVRQIILSDNKRIEGYEQLQLVCIVNGSTVSMEQGPQALQQQDSSTQPPPPPPAAATTSPNDDSSHEGFTLYPSGAYHQVVKEGSGPNPTLTQHVKYEYVEWSHGFYKYTTTSRRGRTVRVSDLSEVYREAILSMREGELRRLIVTDTPDGKYIELRLISIMDDGTPVGFTQLPSGVQYKIVKEGSGPKPTRDQTVKIDMIEWGDYFGEHNEYYCPRGRDYRMSDWAEWLQAMWTDMRVGEVRRVIVPAEGRHATSYREYRLLAIL
ncbi:unnamed protein product [Vitrella brassicaformis CCMP3155]|uniref:Peptidylprolyl isomerase n=1 Tax=Vitrella brassicaformis (strain CCMP3155) TaxID=1169540 RepID=A0A0G4F202_VITBC|nr:unnamed protein product [Vitrella brassicaformis CCMP3155]|eukprot:CEM05778.1 unnamed protein product [Vitrella brassicaformis CCMP3155]